MFIVFCHVYCFNFRHLYGFAERRFSGRNKCAFLDPSLVHWRMCQEENGAAAMNHIHQTFAAHRDKTIFLAPYLQEYVLDICLSYDFNNT